MEFEETRNAAASEITAMTDKQHALVFVTDEDGGVNVTGVNINPRIEKAILKSYIEQQKQRGRY